MFWQSSFIYTLRRSVSLLTSASNFQTIVAGIRHTAILFLMQSVMDYLLALQDFDF